MPTASTMPNITIILSVYPNRYSHKNAIKNDVGIATPTIMAERSPSAATITTITNNIAVRTDDVRPPNESFTKIDRSPNTSYSIAAGQLRDACSASRLASSIVSTILAPARLLISMPIAFSPLNSAYPGASTKVRRTLATSPIVTTLSPFARTGITARSCAVRTSPGTFTEYRPSSRSSVPAVTS